MILPFAKWVENEESGALSPPQHKADEADKALDDIIAKRLMQLTMEMEMQGKGSRQDILQSMQRIIGSTQKQQNAQQPNQQEPPQDPAQAQNQAQPAQGQQPPDISGVLK